MKTILAAALVASLAVLNASDLVSSDSVELQMDDLFVCGWYPVCGDPDIYSPVLQPKDAKTTTDPKDVKDEAIA